jgi:hypothetical protein
MKGEGRKVRTVREESKSLPLCRYYGKPYLFSATFSQYSLKMIKIGNFDPDVLTD